MQLKEEVSFFHRYSIWTIVIILLFLSYLIIKEYLIALISAFVLAFLIKPLFDRLNRHISQSLSALVSVFVLIIIFIIPFAIILGSIGPQAYQIFDKDNISRIATQLTKLPFLKDSSMDLTGLAQEIGDFVLNFLTNILLQIPSLLIFVLIMLLATYYLLLKWDDLADILIECIPFREKKRISKEIAHTTKKLVRGQLFIAIIEFIVAFIGFYIAGVPYFIVLPLLIAIAAFIPGIGPIMIWGPVAVYYLVTTNYYAAIVITITGLIISFVIDYFLVMKVMGTDAKIHPLVLLLGILGGVPIFGIFGVIIGPLILIYTIKFLEEELNEHRK